MENILKNFSSSCHHNSCHIKSFWAGKLIQGLHFTTDNFISTQAAASSENPPTLPSAPSKPPPPPLSSTPSEELQVSPDHSHGCRAQPLPQDIISKALQCLDEKGTTLSPKVHEVILGVSESNILHEEGDIVTDKATLDWGVVSKYINKERSDLGAGARECLRIADHVHQQFLKDKELSLKLRDINNFSWTPFPQVCLGCVSNVTTRGSLSNSSHPESAPGSHPESVPGSHPESVPGSHPESAPGSHPEFAPGSHPESAPGSHPESGPFQVLVPILLGTAALERALGDVLLSVSKCKQCPSLLRDLLLRKELEIIFSPIAMCLLRCLIGSPSGLNLRNILWHGFAEHGEISLKFPLLLCVLIASLGERLLLPFDGETPPALVHRPFISLPQESELNRIFKKDLSPISCSSLKKLHTTSYFIIPTMVPTWQALLCAFMDNNYGVCLCLLLPLLEHSLRRVFTCVNDCPNRVLTAEADSLYTTFDEMLIPTLPDNEPNKLINEIGLAKMEMLLDVLVHPEGPRLRDRVSHGEVSYTHISRTFANHMISLTALFCFQYSLTEDSRLLDGFEDSLAVENSYVSLFHPLSLLKKELEYLGHELEQWKTIPILPDLTGEEGEGECGCATTTRQQHVSHLILEQLETPPPCHSYSTGMFREVLTSVWSHVNTLFVAKKELELVGVMRRTVTTATRAAGQVRETATLRYSQHRERKLRSRQRANFKILLLSLPLYQESLDCVLLFITLTTSCLQKHPNDLNKCIKFHKKVLQFSENLTTFSSPTSNKWDEANSICNTLTTSIEKHLTVST